jgi:hypothetical protein
MSVRVLPRYLRLAVCLLAVSLACACQATGDEAEEDPEVADEAAEGGPGALPPGFGPVVIPHAVPRRAEANVQERRALEAEFAGWEEKLELARSYTDGGYDEEALQILETSLAHDPPAEIAVEMRTVKTHLLMRRAEEVLLRVEARPDRDYVSFGSDVDFVIRFRNVSDEVLALLPPDPGTPTSPSAVMLEITRRDRDIYATELERSWNQTVFLYKPGDPAIEIPPGGFHDLPVRIPGEDAGPPISGLRVIEVMGMMRPTRLKRGDEWRIIRLRVRPGRVAALPDGYEPLVERPLHSMRTAVETVAPIHLLLATEFVASGQRVEAVEILANVLAGGNATLERAALGGLGLMRARAVGEPLAPLARPLIEALRRARGSANAVTEGLTTLTGERFAPDKRFWMDWWRRERGRHTLVTASSGKSS